MINMPIEIDLAELKMKRLNDQIELVETFLRLHVGVLWCLSTLWANHRSLLDIHNTAMQELIWLRDANRHMTMILMEDESFIEVD